MGFEAQKDDASSRLIAAGRAMLAEGDARFSLTKLCAQAGVSLDEFRASFTSKAELLRQLTQTSKSEPAPTDAWLERRLRVFERALSGLEERAEMREREHRLMLGRLEERLVAMEGSDIAAPAALITPAPQAPAVKAVLLEAPTEEIESVGDTNEETAESKPVPSPFLLEPLEKEPIARIDMDALEAARQAALAHGRALEQPAKRRLPTRWLVIAMLATVALFVCATLTLIHAAPESTAHRTAAVTPLDRLTARADSGDAAAQRLLALDYLRGQGVAHNEAAASRWADAAARRGDPEAQYLIGSLSADEPARAFIWFRRGAELGNVKAMHNLAIAYAQGKGTQQNDTAAVYWFGRAATLGYVDSAFDLGVLYESGKGVAQDAKAALHWYDIAAAAGDAEAASRARTLRAQAHI